MGKVVTGISMSLDGFIAAPDGNALALVDWYFNGDTEVLVQGGRMKLKVSKASAKLLEEATNMNGAMVTGRDNFDLSEAWHGTPPFEPCFVVTHSAPQEWVKEGSPFVFVTDGVESAIRQAKKAAGDKNVAIATAKITQQALNLGLLDEIHVDVVDVLIGEGIRLFENLDAPIELEITQVVRGEGVTHLTYRVVK